MSRTLKEKAIVPVHVAFVDGSGWASVYQILKNDGYDVSVVQIPGFQHKTMRFIDSVTYPYEPLGN